MRIRPARSADAIAAQEIAQRAYGVYVERIGRRPAPMDDDYGEKAEQGRLLLADDDRHGIVGIIVLVREPDHLLIENIAVDPERQGMGVGRALLSYAETDARRHGLDTLRLYTNAAMTENLALYRRLGYREDDRRGEHGFERVFLSKRLSRQEE